MNVKSVRASYCPFDNDNSKYNIFENRRLQKLSPYSHTAHCERQDSFSQVVLAAAGAVNYTRPKAYAYGLIGKYRSALLSLSPLGTDGLWPSSRAVIFSILFICLALATSCTAEATRQQDLGSNNQPTEHEQALTLEPADSVVMFGSMLTLGRYLAIMQAAAEREAASKAGEKGGTAP